MMNEIENTVITTTTTLSSPSSSEVMTTTTQLAAVADATTTTVVLLQSPLVDTTQSTENCIENAAKQQTTAALLNPYEMMTALEKLEHLTSNNNVVERQMGIRGIMDTLHEVRGSENDLRRVLEIFTRLSSDKELNLRAEIAELLPHVVAYFVDQVICLSRPIEFLQIGLSSLETLLLDEHPQVRKIAQTSLTSILEQGFTGGDFIEQKITKVILRLMENQDEQYRVEALITLNKVLRYMEKETIEKLFVERFCQLCSDSSCVRRVCASNFGEFCTVIGQQVTEDKLLVHFKSLCEDEVWGVRKSCADVFVPVSCVCSNEARRYLLAPLFVHLLCDNSKWVKSAAFQALGPFISTFADPTKTGLYYNDGSVIVVDEGKDHDSNDSGCSVHSGESNVSPELEEFESHLDNDFKNLSLKASSGDHQNHSVDLVNDQQQQTALPTHSHQSSLSLATNVEAAFDTFQFWRDPLPQVDLNEINLIMNVNSDSENVNEKKVTEQVEDLEASEDKKSGVYKIRTICDFEQYISDHYTEYKENNNNNNNNNDHDHHHHHNSINRLSQRAKPLNVYVSYNNLEGWIADDDGGSGGTSPPLLLKFTIKPPSLRKPALQQDIIPADLLEHYLSMTMSSDIFHDALDSDLTQYCAYSLPAVALTLGRRYWPCLRDTYLQLASDMQWKVRWTLASSLHQMSLILGPEYTTQDLLPVFLNFVKDLDEVRFGILQNLSAILEVLSAEERVAVLPKISEFLKMDYPRNWRFRCTLAHQLLAISHLYSAQQVAQFLLPIGFSLMLDKIAEVRRSAVHLLSNLLERIFCDKHALQTTTTASSQLPAQEMSKEIECSKDGEMNLTEAKCVIFSELNSFLATSKKWYLRQSFVFLSERLLLDGALPFYLFVESFLEPLEKLADDPVPNVRLALSRCMAQVIAKNEMLWKETRVKNIYHKLENDSDRDVRYYLNTGSIA